MSVNIISHSNIYTLSAQQVLPISISEAWKYFSSPENLKELTPPEMQMNVTSGKPEKAYAGQIITYNLAVAKGIRINWVTEITQVLQEKMFIDEQRFGPYKMWHHEHTFEKIDEHSCLMKDKISYKLPLGFLGKIAHVLFVKNQLKGIFNFREQKVNEVFGKL
ncbi:SRPBCC family protein [Flavicella sediminum]|uniref:SRPBCC family protein n=1 Tax=Flavicella sediminum TaxID=2585141 RepID=UPI0011214209|nr:SRPBCC family protein [Flavicella sediminum]